MVINAYLARARGVQAPLDERHIVYWNLAANAFTYSLPYTLPWISLGCTFYADILTCYDSPRHLLAL